MEKSYKEYLPQIKTFIFDVDGVLTNGIVTIMPDGEMIRQMSIKDGYALKSAVNAGFRVCVISGGTNEGVRTRLYNLGLTDVYLGAHNKSNQFNELVKKYDLNPMEIAYMGDDIPDLPVLGLVGLPTCPNDAAPEIQKICKYISNKKGGEGCARDLIEQVLRVQEKWEGNFNAE
jgi:3-deoxy-D-manno-octulosonate 8-phosphate phosphatase (KDO 8-P phosphatase)